MHFTETCDEGEQSIHLMTQVTTTSATTADALMLSPILDDLRQQDLAASSHLVDMGYTSGEELAKQADLGTEVLGPVVAPSGWQTQHQGGFAPTDFVLDWHEQQATCPQGQHSLTWKPGQDGNRAVIKIHFATAICRECPVRQHGTQSSRGRSLTILPKPAQEAREERLREQASPAFRAWLCPTSRHRSDHLRGRAQQGLAPLSQSRSGQSAFAACHDRCGHQQRSRLDLALQQRALGKPVRPVRPLAPFARLKERACA